ncbi:Uncharacterised protein [BD1-7 clade bacterium]|uniref:Outer membrane protein beta-barrel domain-containing protein n=1 Tax=BD1-7 clade bacterium TaxID=2029982 RepID=A0A5S9NMX0_9GAMM|nr:Uncharacterised protein [BD1-7 clade bacterium]CAA0093960.1 Uncharacterised protein [BD1-7 clade bacterium]
MSQRLSYYLAGIGLSLATSTVLANDHTHFNYFGNLSLKSGYATSHTEVTNIDGGATGAIEPVRDGYNVEASLAFSLPQMVNTKPYIDYQWIGHSNRHTNSVSVGLKQYFDVIPKHFSVFGGFGIGYYQLDWDSAPANAVRTGSQKSKSVGGSFQAGMDWFMIHNLSLNFTVRVDVTNHQTVLESAGGSTIFNQDNTLSTMFGLSWWFDRKESPIKVYNFDKNKQTSTHRSSGGRLTSADHASQQYN